MWHRIVAMLRLGKVTLMDDTGPVRLLQVREGDLGQYGGPVVAPAVPHVAEFGFASAPPAGADVMLASSQGDRTRTIAIGTNHPLSRPRDLKPGDACMHDVRGARVWLTDAGLVIDGAGLPATIRNVASLAITSAGPVTIDAPSVAVAHDVTVGGEIVAQGAVRGRGGAVELGAVRDAYAEHAHTGVATGSGTSGGTNKPA